MGGNVVFPIDFSHAVTRVLPTLVARDHQGSEGSTQKQTTNTRIMMKTKWHWACAVPLTVVSVRVRRHYHKQSVEHFRWVDI
jgi:ribosomal protein S26